MKLLAIDTSENGCTAALHIDGRVIERFEFAPRKHTDLILPMIDQVMADAQLSPTQLDALAYGCGPGSFTGIRVGAGVIQGIAIAADLPVVPVSTLAALSQGAYREFGSARVLAAFDARMQEVYWGGYRLDEQNIMQAVIEDCVAAPDKVAKPEDPDWVGAGSGWSAYLALAEGFANQVNEIYADLLVHAQDVAVLAASQFEQGKAVSAEFALPVYLRESVAKKKAQQGKTGK